MTQSINLQDADQRKQALDPNLSFIVQAPAGSGKTELLTQRFLVLLSYVKQPEEILAITFTKKSAAEMRTRIIKALLFADAQPEPDLTHEKQTWHLAKKVLHQNAKLNWNLLTNPNRLQIQTIDSFNATLTRQLPLLAHFGAPLEIADDATHLYEQAVQEFLLHLEENVAWVTAIETLLRHMDNDLSTVANLLVNMLAKRDQWLPYIATNANNPTLRNILESQLTTVIQTELQALRDSFPETLVTELINLLQFACHNLSLQQTENPITECAQLTNLPGIDSTDKKYWLGIANFLLTKDKNWRKKLTIAEGFPAPSSATSREQKAYFSDYKSRMTALIHELQLNETLHQHFIALHSLPESHYRDTDWQTLAALHDILRVVVAQLKLVFQEHCQIDYIENALAALTALGEEDDPTDLTLALDYKIQHILIDEFQDTSNSQYRLLTKLLNGWQSDDGRTLFVVGDPMQSIYRFREAEVGLFLAARKKGIELLSLIPLTLAVNFRSNTNIVNWVNDHFVKVFPQTEDIFKGAVPYTPSIAHHTAAGSVALHPFINCDDAVPAAAIVQLIKEKRQLASQEKIAILVRSRLHLKNLIPALKAANLPFRAVDIEPLVARPVIQDLLALTRALLNPADRIAWLAILRAPWCGLTLNDLWYLSLDRRKQIIPQVLRDNDVIQRLSMDGQIRLQRITNILLHALGERRRYPLRYWVEATWLQLGGPASVDQTIDLMDADSYFNLLAKLDKANDLPDLQILTEAVEDLFAAPNNTEGDFLQIMTIHNAKGLEFDCVILPYLDKGTARDKKQLLQWMEWKAQGLILAPIHAVGEAKTNSIYDYIKEQHAIKNQYENGRLLYVAATRAKKELHLFFQLETNQDQTTFKTPTANCLLNKLWPALQSSIIEKNSSPLSSAISADKSPNPLKRLHSEWKNPLTKNYFAATAAHQSYRGFEIINRNLQYLGTVIHLVLQQIALHGINWWLEQTTAAQDTYLHYHLRQMGCDTSFIPEGLAKIKKALTNTLDDPRGRWIVNHYDIAQAEFSLTLAMNNKIKNLIIDRTFIDPAGVCWIIDYKSTDFTGSNRDVFLQHEKNQHAAQLQEYARAIQKIEPDRVIRLGLYFPLLPAWLEWDFG